MKVRNLSNIKFGKLTVIERAKNTRNGKAQWECLCDCGNKKIIIGNNLLSGTTKSCGCTNINRLKQATNIYKNKNIKLYRTSIKCL